MKEKTPKPDKIDVWSEVKLHILKEYSTKFSTMLHGSSMRGRPLDHFYIDAFAGAGIHISKRTGEMIPGSPLNALNVIPPFKRFFFIDLDDAKVDLLRERVGDRSDVEIFAGDCNNHLLKSIFPRIHYRAYQTALCLLDPYGLHLNWEVMKAAGQDRAFELFLNFPVMDMNRNVLWTDSTAVDPKQRARMDAFWGDGSWREAAYDTQSDMFGFPEKLGNEEVVMAFRDRLRKVAGFDYVPDPLPMKNNRRSDIYYLFFASHHPKGDEIAKAIFRRERRKMD